MGEITDEIIDNPEPFIWILGFALLTVIWGLIGLLIGAFFLISIKKLDEEQETEKEDEEEKEDVNENT